METAEIRRRWLRYFGARGHAVVPSASLIPARTTSGNAPRAAVAELFVGSAMEPFTPYLFGVEPAPFTRATSVQKCVRAQDIPQVGQTSRHSTFFQMNGNYSIGDYGAAGAIELAWELITRHQSDGGYGLDESRLWVTVLHDDTETIRAWEEVAGLPAERIIRRGPNENYWHAELPGPGGPRSAIFADRGRDYGPDGGPDADEDRYLQFWNLTFLRDQVSGVRGMGQVEVGDRLPLRTIGSGMGLERMACLLQGVDNVCESDEVFAVIVRAEELSGRRYGLRPDDDTRMRVIADHVRAALMLLADGVSPADPGESQRGSVVRALLRGTVRSLRELGVQDPALVDLLSVSRDRMDAAYPELDDDFTRIAQLAAHEEQSITEAPAAEPAGSEPAPAIQVTESRPSESQPSPFQPTEFTGFRELTTDSVVLGLIVDDAPVESADKGQTVQVVLARTPFFAAAGGQAADQGDITAEGAHLRVIDVQSMPAQPVQAAHGVVVHTAEVAEGTIHTGQDVLASVDREWRLSACQAHSATHVVHAALRQVLGPQAIARGSANQPGQLWLDIAGDSALSRSALDEVESVANLALRYDHPVTATYMPLDQARELGALELDQPELDQPELDQPEPGLDEPNLVRVVEMGGAWSRELCSGTHVEHASQIGAITITGESAAGPGIRRVHALAGLDALHYLTGQRSIVRELSDVLRADPEQLTGLVTKLAGVPRADAATLARTPADVFGVSVVTHDAGTGGADDARALAIDVRERMPADRPSVVAVSVLVAQKPLVVVTTNGEARDWGVSAGDLIREAATVLGAGDPAGAGANVQTDQNDQNDQDEGQVSDVSGDIAQGKGNDPAKVGEALRRIEHSVGERVTSRG